MSVLSQTVHQNAVAPYAFRYVVTPEDASLNLATIVSASLAVQHEDGTEATWTASITAASASSLTLVHVYQSGDLPNVEAISVVPILTLPSSAGTIVCEKCTVHVHSRFE